MDATPQSRQWAVGSDRACGDQNFCDPQTLILCLDREGDGANAAVEVKLSVAHLESPTDVSLSLSAQPQGWSSCIPGLGIDLSLSGHTHGGQVALSFTPSSAEHISAMKACSPLYTSLASRSSVTLGALVPAVQPLDSRDVISACRDAIRSSDSWHCQISRGPNWITSQVCSVAPDIR